MTAPKTPQEWQQWADRFGESDDGNEYVMVCILKEKLVKTQKALDEATRGLKVIGREEDWTCRCANYYLQKIDKILMEHE